MMFYAAFCIAISANAVPSGSYSDGRGNKVVISDSQNVYRVDSNGNVQSRWKIIKENQDGSFCITLLDQHENVIDAASYNCNNGWWRENGAIYLNLAFCRRTLTHD